MLRTTGLPIRSRFPFVAFSLYRTGDSSSPGRFQGETSQIGFSSGFGIFRFVAFVAFYLWH
jgi:hypothetical protein